MNPFLFLILCCRHFLMLEILKEHGGGWFQCFGAAPNPNTCVPSADKDATRFIYGKCFKLLCLYLGNKKTQSVSRGGILSTKLSPKFQMIILKS